MYALGHAELGEYGRLMAAVLAGGSGALLSHQSAGDLSEILRTSSALIHVTTPNRRRRRLETIVFHRARELHPCVPPNRLRQAIEQSERIGMGFTATEPRSRAIASRMRCFRSPGSGLYG